ncbi:hypothetical protein CIK06_01870 [Plantactinospora sp. KBS50]|nr:hypothetical protein CIK06_01870 [Plantactinospora sp. KBS50]
MTTPPPAATGGAGRPAAAGIPTGAEETQVVRIGTARTTSNPTDTDQTQVIRTGTARTTSNPTDTDQTQVIRTGTARTTSNPTDTDQTQVIRTGTARTTSNPTDTDQTQVIRASVPRATSASADADQTQVIRQRPVGKVGGRPGPAGGFDGGATQVVPTPPAGQHGWSRPGGGYGGYGGYEQSDLGQRTVPVLPPSVENSGSLTGHILAQGWSDAPAQRDNGTAKVVIVLAVGLGVVVLVGLLVAAVLADAFRSIFGGALGN